MGFHRLIPADKLYSEAVFALLSEIQLFDPYHRKSYRASPNAKDVVEDSIASVTALAYNLELNTRNIADFDHIPGLRLVNPIM